MKEIKKIHLLDAVVSVPGSKSYTQRALVAAALAEGTSRLHNCLDSEDTNLLARALRTLGADISPLAGETLVRGTGGRLQTSGEPLYLGNNGTGFRFLTAVTSLCDGPAVIDGDSRLRERPVGILVDAVNAAGGNCVSLRRSGYPPVRNSGGGLRGGRVRFGDSDSSQYISALLLTAPYASEDLIVELEGRVPSLPYVDMTLEVMRRFGVDVKVLQNRRFLVAASGGYRASEFLVEGDASSASYFFLAAAICGGRVRVKNIDGNGGQGDLGILNILVELGCSVRRDDEGIEVEGGPLAEGERRYDLSAMPDMVPGLAVLMAFRRGRTTIGNVSHLRIKESDRLAALTTELNRVGIDARETGDGLVIEGGTPRGAEIQTYGDHRIAMSFAVAGLRTGDMKVVGEGCVVKSFPTFWTVLEELSS